VEEIRVVANGAILHFVSAFKESQTVYFIIIIILLLTTSFGLKIPSSGKHLQTKA